MARSEIKWIELGQFIEARNERNSNLQYDESFIEGVNSNGQFIPTKAITDGINMKPYKIVHQGDFVYNPSRLNIGSLSYREGGLCIVSHLYVVFRITDEGLKSLLPYYLFIFFQRDEFLRTVNYLNYGSQRAEFNIHDISKIKVPIPFKDGAPDLAKQREIVSEWKGLREMKEQNEQIAQPLMKLCQSFIEECKKKYPTTEIGPFITRSDSKNSDNKIKIVKSVSVTKAFNDTNAKVDKNNLKGYKIVKPGQVSFVQTTGNEKCLCIAVNHFDYPIVVTSVNEVFETNQDKLLADYLHLYCCRKETDRYVRFHSWGSARETFTWLDMCRFKIPLPPIDVQQAIVNIYKSAQEAKKIAEEADKLSNEICPALIQHVIHS